ncbi:sigma-54-dependent Fis family transcriptional regulator [Sandaracinus amylolyticus]|uniref:Hydrogenase-4 transcriptional activator n=1 Tax=Sandaracinus amylolyticus TaxID=927083 RepID=A0A0F6VZH2_9BACT|nr:sigma-54-dependent Fis family transcriptional regulator [Sandaracinus amylolyticus]AKF03446.1 Hydrogenase-4 transcriptional activator [Sandaracinus amylolyticus]
MGARSDDETVRRERDVFLRVLELGGERDPRLFLDQALELFLELTGAQLGYLALSSSAIDAPEFETSRGIDTQATSDVRRSVSQGIIAAALSQGETIQTLSAIADGRFSDRPSVKRSQIGAVLCAPIGSLGVVYVQETRGGRPFPPDVEQYAALVARLLAPAARSVLAERAAVVTSDPTRPYRERLRLDDIVGRSAALANVFRHVGLVAPLDIDLLITGPSGTGKSQLARAIIANSRRAAGPFIEVNCAAVPEALFESELFGARRGAHSTAFHDTEGRVAAAEGGTLFLDEIAELSLASQAKLLTLLQARTYQPLGAPAPRRADIRVIAATNSDLAHAVEERRFREDLFYRLSVMPVDVPALSARSDDIAPLASHFCERAAERHGLGRIAMTRDALSACEAHDWPGNVRQLAHAIEAGVIRAAGSGRQSVHASDVFPSSRDSAVAETLGEATRAFQARYIRDVLTSVDWNVSEAARRLDIARSHLYTLIRTHDIRRER